MKFGRSSSRRRRRKKKKKKQLGKESQKAGASEGTGKNHDPNREVDWSTHRFSSLRSWLLVFEGVWFGGNPKKNMKERGA